MFLNEEMKKVTINLSGNCNRREMRGLIVDDEFVSRKKAQRIMSQYGECDIATNGTETLEAFRLAHDEGRPYDLITMDILIPDMDGS
ncbi:unnamed protein product [marine sediment metagenome]|uniref:Response regulatory domain-containing protein n=1 Tax=marine sediment metagenome TaxID=412755 RepID=X0SVP0_9ZZZZ